VLAGSCERPFERVFDRLPSQAMEGVAVHELCPLTCRQCGAGTLLREEILAGNLWHDPAGAGQGVLAGKAEARDDFSTLSLLDECNPGRGGADSGGGADLAAGANSSTRYNSSAGTNASAGSNYSVVCRGGRGVWGAIWDSKPPVGENSRYRPPQTVLGYARMTDATSWTRLEKKDEKGCLRYFKVTVPSMLTCYWG
jgi:hypothetical protein